MTALQAHQFPSTGQQLRTVLVDDEPWFVAVDVAAALDLGNLHSSLALLDDDERSLHTVESGQRSMATVSEAGLYSLILRSRKAEAKVFKRWVTHEVLPAIRRTGRYEVTPLDELEVARRYVASLEAQRQLAAKVEELTPSAAAWDHLASGDGDWPAADAAKILSRDPNIKTGRDRLYSTLASWGWVFRAGDGRWRAKQSQVDNGRLSEIPMSHYHPRTGELVLDPPQVRIKPKGLVEIHRRLGGSAPLAVQQQLELPA